MARIMSREAHIQRHKELHRNLDELVADMITETNLFPSQMSVLDLMKWSSQQMINPTEREWNE